MDTMPVFTSKDVSKDVEAICSKCGQSWHVIVAVVDGKIAQVECKSCGGRHKYKPVATKDMTTKKSTRTTVAASTKAGSPLPKKEKAPAAPKILLPQCKTNDRPLRKYNMHEADYQLGDRIEHPKFGLGTVDGFPAANKMNVTFDYERVLLVYGK